MAFYIVLMFLASAHPSRVEYRLSLQIIGDLDQLASGCTGIFIPIHHGPVGS